MVGKCTILFNNTLINTMKKLLIEGKLKLVVLFQEYVSLLEAVYIF